VVRRPAHGSKCRLVRRQSSLGAVEMIDEQLVQAQVVCDHERLSADIVMSWPCGPSAAQYSDRDPRAESPMRLLQAAPSGLHRKGRNVPVS